MMKDDTSVMTPPESVLRSPLDALDTVVQQGQQAVAKPWWGEALARGVRKGWGRRVSDGKSTAAMSYAQAR